MDALRDMPDDHPELRYIAGLKVAHIDMVAGELLRKSRWQYQHGRLVRWPRHGRCSSGASGDSGEKQQAKQYGSSSANDMILEPPARLLRRTPPHRHHPLLR